MAVFPIQMNLSGGDYHTPTIFDFLPKVSNIPRHRQRKSSLAMAPAASPLPTGSYRKLSSADSGVGIQEDQQPKDEPLYGDLKNYLAEKQKHWRLARDVELARPLETEYRAYEAEVSMEIRRTEAEWDRAYNRRRREMRGATGLARVSWTAYRVKAGLASAWRHHRLHHGLRHRRLGAKKRELNEEYVRAQVQRRMALLREIVCFAGEEGVEDRDDGGYVRDGMLRYIMTGYDSLFPIARELMFEIQVPWKEERDWFTVNPFARSAPEYGWGF